MICVMGRCTLVNEGRDLESKKKQFTPNTQNVLSISYVLFSITIIYSITDIRFVGRTMNCNDFSELLTLVTHNNNDQTMTINFLYYSNYPKRRLTLTPGMTKFGPSDLELHGKFFVRRRPLTLSGGRFRSHRWTVSFT